MQCNIDARGKRVRLLIGLASLAAAAVVAALILLNVIPGGWMWTAVVCAAGCGAFGVFEARNGWCAMRAMGFRTPF